MRKQYEGQMTIEDVFGISLSPSSLKSPPQTSKTKRSAEKTAAPKTVKRKRATAPSEQADALKIKQDTGAPPQSFPDPEAASEETKKQIENVLEAAKKKNLYPGDKARIEEAVLKDSDSMSTYVLVINALSDVSGEPWTPCGDGTMVKFTRGYVTIRDSEGETVHIAWAPIYRSLCALVKEKKWLTPKERKKDREEGEGAKGRRRGW